MVLRTADGATHADFRSAGAADAEECRAALGPPGGILPLLWLEQHAQVPGNGGPRSRRPARNIGTSGGRRGRLAENARSWRSALPGAPSFCQWFNHTAKVPGPASGPPTARNMGLPERRRGRWQKNAERRSALPGGALLCRLDNTPKVHGCASPRSTDGDGHACFGSTNVGACPLRRARGRVTIQRAQRGRGWDSKEQEGLKGPTHRYPRSLRACACPARLQTRDRVGKCRKRGNSRFARTHKYARCPLPGT